MTNYRITNNIYKEKRMEFKKVLLESREGDFRKKFTQKFGSQNVERIINMVIPKYLNWVGKHLDTISFEDNYSKTVAAVKKFDKIYNNLPKTDLYQYQNLQELYDAIQKHETRNVRNPQDMEGSKKVYEDDTFYVTNPLTYEASCYYGKGTKWCTASATDEYHFRNKNSEGKLFYIINKKLPTNDVNYKVALYKSFEEEESFWNAKDDQIRSGWIFGTEELTKIKLAIDEYMETEYKEQLEIYRDKERKRKEQQRLRQLEIERRQRQLESEAEERREENEWELGPDCPEEGLRAHALLDWLEDTSDIDKLTLQDRVRLDELKENLEQLNERLEELEDAGEDTDEITGEIEDIEDEISDIEEKKDVYNIIPIGKHYDMYQFEVIGLDGREYAVGDEDEIRRSCVEYLEGLIDDIGVDGFGNNFYLDYLDYDRIYDEAESYYSDYVRDEPESWFDESERELSREQESDIEKMEIRIEGFKNTIANYEQIKDTMLNGDEESYDDEEYELLEEKIAELESEIEELENEIEEIKDSPEGDFPEDLIEEKIEELANDAKDDGADWLKEYGLDVADYVNVRDFIDGIIDTDGYGHTLNSYDGTADEVQIEGVWYYVIRIN